MMLHPISSRRAAYLCAFVLVFCALIHPPASLGESAAEDIPDEYIYPDIFLELRPGSVYSPGIDGVVSWLSDAPETAVGRGNDIFALNEGFAMLTAVHTDGSETYYDVEVSENAVPPLIRSAIALALKEWEDNLGKTFTQRNKYTAWYCGTGPKCYFGWCGGFVSYCLDIVGVPMDDPPDSVPHDSGEPYAVHAAGVGKILKGFNNMNRVTNIPRPGYLVIYGKRDYYNYVHVGMITDVEDLGDGLFLVKTVEGNLSSRIKRYCYLYDSNDTTEHNYRAPDEEYQTDPDTFQYGVHQKQWFIYAICQTWY